MQQQITLGQALAYLHIGRAMAERGQEAAGSTADLVENLTARLEAISNTPGELGRISASIPASFCPTEASYLANNIDFLIVHFLLQPDIAGPQSNCAALYRHLNACYVCFEEFCEVARDFHLSSRGRAEHSL